MSGDSDPLVVTDNNRVFTGAQFLCEALAQSGVTHVFGGHGGAVVPLIDAIVAHPKLTWVYARCETNASQMAAAYAKLKGGLGCCVATSGPGASHLLSGLIDADQDRVPVVCITGMKDLGHTRHADFQDIDQAAIFRMAGLALSECVSSINQLLPLTRNAFTASITANRCTHIAIPIDIQMQEIEARTDFCLGTSYFANSCVPASRLQVETLATALRSEIESDRRVIIACGYRASKVGALVERFAELLHAPMLTSYDGKGTVDEHHPLAYGVVGVYGNVGTGSATDLLDQCQTVIGICVNEWSELILDKAGLQVRRFIQIDERLVAGDSLRFDPTATFSCGFLSESLHRVIDVLEEDLSRSAKHAQRVTMTAGALQKGLAKRATVSIQSDTYEPKDGAGIWSRLKQGSFAKPTGTPSTLTTGRKFTVFAKTEDTEHCHPALFFNTMSDYLDEDSIICADIGDNALFMASSLIAKRGQRFLTSEHLGIMGYSINSGLAAATLSSKAKKMVVAGDGGVQMSINELATLKDHHVSNLVVIVIKNGKLGRVNNETWGPGLYADGCAVGAPDFVKLFEAYGYPEGKVLSTCEVEVIENTIEEAWDVAEKNGCCVIEIMQDPDTCPIMHKLKFRASLHTKPYTLTRSDESSLPKLKVDMLINERPTIQQWLNGLTEETRSFPYWLDRGDLLLAEPAKVVESLLASLGGLSTSQLFQSHDDRIAFNTAYDAAILNAVPARDLLEEVVAKGCSNGHPLKLQLVAFPPNLTHELHSHPSVEVSVPLVGKFWERFLFGATLAKSIMAGDTIVSNREESGHFYEPPSDEQLSKMKDSLQMAVDEQILSLGKTGHFVERANEEGQVMYYEPGSIHQSFTKDEGCLVLAIWSGVRADLDMGTALGIEGQDLLTM